MVIYKYNIDGGGRVLLPQGALILDIQYQQDVLMLWALVDPEKPGENRSFVVFGTGWTLSADHSYKYWKTIQQGAFVWHIFEVIDNRRGPMPFVIPSEMVIYGTTAGRSVSDSPNYQEIPKQKGPTPGHGRCYRVLSWGRRGLIVKFVSVVWSEGDTVLLQCKTEDGTEFRFYGHELEDKEDA